MKRWSTIIRERYKVISSIGMEGLKDIIRRKEEGKDYWDAVKDYHVDFILEATVDKKKGKLLQNKMKEIRWKP